METKEQTFCYLPHYCSCVDHEPMTLDPNKMKRYEREGYPKFIKGHMHKYHTPWNKNKKWSQNIKDKISNTCKENTQKSDYVHPFLGKHHTQESIEKNREKHLGTKYAEGHIVSEQQKEIQRQKMLGRTSPMKGVKRKLESNLLQSIAMKGKEPWNKGLIDVQESPMKGKHHSSETIEKIKENTPIKSGGDHWNWQGGITPLYKQIRFCEEYDIWRTQVFERDLYVCQDCRDITKRNLEAHHLKLFSLILKENNIDSLDKAKKCLELWDLNNGITLCQDCHNKTKGIIGEEIE